jgi:putative flavoprotein involved in K+ transport
MDVTGVFHERYDQIEDLVRARRLPSLQLVGSPEHATLDLNALTSIGVKIVGRLVGVRDGKAQFSGSLRNQCALSDLKMGRLLDAIDLWATDNGMNGEVGEPMRFAPTMVEDSPPLGLDLSRGEIETVVWATGYRPDTSWLHVHIMDRKGRIRHDGGVTESPGMYLMGMQFLRRRNSALIDGAGEDARDLTAHLAAFLDGHVTAERLKSG